MVARPSLATVVDACDNAMAALRWRWRWQSLIAAAGNPIAVKVKAGDVSQEACLLPGRLVGAAVYRAAVRKTLSATGLFSASGFGVNIKTGQHVENRYQMRKGRAANRGTQPDHFVGLDDEDEDSR